MLVSINSWFTAVWSSFSGLENGSKADWLAALGSISALLFAGIAVRSTQKTIRQQSRQLAVMEEDRRTAQASKIAIWLDYRPCRPHSTRLSTVAGPGEPHYVIHNSSNLPIYDATAFLFRASEVIGLPSEADDSEEGPTRSEDELPEARNPVYRLVIPPGELVIPLPRGTSDIDPTTGIAALTFTDASSDFSWVRMPDGQLVEYASYSELKDDLEELGVPDFGPMKEPRMPKDPARQSKLSTHNSN